MMQEKESKARKSFLLRIDPALLESLQRWADEDLRSLNGQIEFLLRKALAEAWRLRPAPRQEPEKEAHEL